MPYGKFTTVGQVAETFGISLRKAWFLQDVKKGSIKVPDYKTAEIKKRLSNTSALRNEAARCNQIITPILNIVVDEHEPLQLWIEEPFNVDESNGLTGTPDYLIALETAGEEMAVPPICVIEAKQDKFDEGWTQALAEMVAASMKGSGTCYGIVTTGKAWEFGKLENNVFTREPDQVTTRNLQDLFDILNWIISLAEKEI
ncbi:Type I restriction enzyme R protein N-terminal domain-containing protein [Candidatus Electrothrix laxa]